MPIHDQGYRRYGGQRVQRRGWWVIASTTIRAQIRRRRVIALLLAAWLPFLVRAVLLYAAANFQQASFLAATPQVFREFLGWQNATAGAVPAAQCSSPVQCRHGCSLLAVRS